MLKPGMRVLLIDKFDGPGFAFATVIRLGKTIHGEYHSNIPCAFVRRDDGRGSWQPDNTFRIMQKTDGTWGGNNLEGTCQIVSWLDEPLC